MSDPVAVLQARFAGLPRHCGQAEPGVMDTDQWRDWSACDTTPDQLRIENYLDRFDLAGKAILHIGIGNSSLAERFHRRAARIVGTTVVAGELAHARSLEISNYQALLHNKYAGAPLGGGFDVIVDNNPTTFCCCLTHLSAMLTFYAAELAPGGRIATDRVGLGWAIDAPGSDPRWGFSYDDLAAAAETVELRAFTMGRNIVVLARAEPKHPGPLDEVLHVVRRFGGKAAAVRRRLGL